MRSLIKSLAPENASDLLVATSCGFGVSLASDLGRAFLLNTAGVCAELRLPHSFIGTLRGCFGVWGDC